MRYVSMPKGGTLSKIAQQENISLKAILFTNGNLDPRRIQIGQKIAIPETEDDLLAITQTRIKQIRENVQKQRDVPVGNEPKRKCGCKPPKWMKIAKKELGTKEIHGKKHNPRVLEYHSVSGGFSTDEVPWCGSFVNWVMKQSKYKTVSYPARAKSWKNFGKKAKKPIYGAIAVKSRRGGGHVAFVVGQSKDGKYLYVLGGNQHDSVNISKYPKSVWTDFRVPSDYDDTKCILPIYDGRSSKGGKES